MEYYLIKTIEIITTVKFTPLVLIGLLITSLSLILNLKEGNFFIDNFKKGRKIKEFVENIHSTTFFLILIFILSFFSNYIEVPEIENFRRSDYFIMLIVSISFYLLLYKVVRSLFSISFVIKEIVKSSLSDINK